MKYNHSLNITSVIVFTFILIVFCASNALTQDLNTTKLSAEIVVGETIVWGHYEQNNDELDGNEPIEWLVLGIKYNKALLISKYCLDCVKYNDDKTPITWSECSLRKWLNSTFYEEAFDDSEKVKIIKKEINNSNNIEYETYGGDKTEDYVFVPSVSNIQRLWAITKSKNVKCTRYAQAKGAFIDSKGFCFYWLRSPGSNKNSAACIQNCELNLNGVSVDAKDWTVRPAIWIDLSK